MSLAIRTVPVRTAAVRTVLGLLLGTQAHPTIPAASTGTVALPRYPANRSQKNVDTVLNLQPFVLEVMVLVQLFGSQVGSGETGVGHKELNYLF